MAASAAGQSVPPKTSAPSKTLPPAAAPEKQAPDDAAKKRQEAEIELQRAIEEAGNDRAEMVRKLEEYLKRFPDAPRKAQVYRALVESCSQLHDYPKALDYAERLIVINPDDNEMMMVAVGLLEKHGDEHSLIKAVGYVSRVIDHIEKISPAEKPARVSMSEWKADQTKLRVAVYLIRGRIEMEQRSYDLAEKDLQRCYQLKSNAPCAERIAEIAEIRKDLPGAISYYANAFVLPENGPGGGVDRREVRQKLGNVWRLVHGSDAGLGEAILAAYDRLSEPPKTGDSPAARNKDAHDPYAFVLRKLNGSPVPLAPLKGKVIVMNFWATWCGPCRQIEPLFAQVAEKFAVKSNAVFFAVNTDEDESRVAPFVTLEKIGLPVVFADGLDGFLGVHSLPTVIVLDRAGKIVYRINGFDADTFVASLTSAIENALGPA